jgi:uncharacterized protein YndB with AHSA1/START domain
VRSEVSINDNVLRITRIFDAPRELVFGFWSTAEKYRQWSGCKEAVKCEVAMDFRVGGSFVQKMWIAVHENTCEFVVSGTYDEIVEPERIVYSAKFGSVAGRVTVEFLVLGKGTKVIVTHEGFPDDFFCQNVARGTDDSFDALESLLGSELALT